MADLKQKYQQEILPVLVKELGLKNPLAAPRLVKVVVNIGLGQAAEDKTLLEKAAADVRLITGQKPKVTKAKKDISGFKLRTGQAIGLATTLRGERMYYFLEKVFRIVSPRIRDFQGFSGDKFDGRGNYHFGFKEYNVFPEVQNSRSEQNLGLQVSIVTSALQDKPARLLLEKLGLPFTKDTK